MKRHNTLLLILMLAVLVVALCACSGGSQSLSGTTWDLSSAVMGGETYTAEDFESMLGDCSFNFKDDTNVTMVFIGSSVECTYTLSDGIITLESEGETEEMTYDGNQILIDLGDGDSMTFTQQ